MPLFALVSGYFAKKVTTKGLGELLFKLLFYQVIFALAFFLGGIISGMDQVINISSVSIFSIFGYLLSPIWLLWYLLSLIIWRLLLFIFSKDKKMLIPAFILGILIIFLPINGYILSLQRTFGLFPFFLIGFYLSYEQVSNLLAMKNRIIKLIVLIGLVCLLYILTFNQLDYELFYYLNHYVDSSDTAIVLICIRILTYLYSLLILSIIMLLVPQHQTKLSFIGVNSFPIYIFHGLVYVILSSFGFFEVLGETKFIVSISIALVLSVTCIFTFGNNKFLRFEQNFSLQNIKKKFGR